MFKICINTVFLVFSEFAIFSQMIKVSSGLSWGVDYA